MIAAMRLWLVLAATLALAACAPPDPQSAEANARDQRVVPGYQAPVYPLTTNCLGSSALTFSCRAY